MSKQRFDPNQPYEEVVVEKPKFDPTKSFEVVGEKKNYENYSTDGSPDSSQASPPQQQDGQNGSTPVVDLARQSIERRRQILETGKSDIPPQPEVSPEKAAKYEAEFKNLLADKARQGHPLARLVHYTEENIKNIANGLAASGGNPATMQEIFKLQAQGGQPNVVGEIMNFQDESFKSLANTAKELQGREMKALADWKQNKGAVQHLENLRDIALGTTKLGLNAVIAGGSLTPQGMAFAGTVDALHGAGVSPELTNTVMSLATTAAKDLGVIDEKSPTWATDILSIGDFLALGLGMHLTGKGIEKLSPKEIQEAAKNADVNTFKAVMTHPENPELAKQEKKILDLTDDQAKVAPEVQPVIEQEIQKAQGEKEQIENQQIKNDVEKTFNAQQEKVKEELNKTAENPDVNEVTRQAAKTMSDELKVGDVVEMDVKPKEGAVPEKTYDEQLRDYVKSLPEDMLKRRENFIYKSLANPDVKNKDVLRNEAMAIADERLDRSLSKPKTENIQAEVPKEEIKSETPIGDEYKSKLEKISKVEPEKDLTNIQEGDFVQTTGNEQKGKVEGFVKKIGKKNITLETPYGGWGGADISLQEVKIGKDEVTSLRKLKPESPPIEKPSEKQSEGAGKEIEPHKEVKADVKTVAKELGKSQADILVYEKLKDVHPDNYESVLSKMDDEYSHEVTKIENKIEELEQKIADKEYDIGNAEESKNKKMKDSVSELEKDLTELTDQKEKLEKQKKEVSDLADDMNDWYKDIAFEEGVDAAKDLIKDFDIRLETRRGVKLGHDLFPELANIPEFKPIQKELQKHIEDGSVTRETIEQFADKPESKEFESAIENIERKAESEKETDLNEAITEADKLVGEKPPVEPPSEKPPEPNEPEKEIGIKNAAVDLQRMERGFEPLISPESKSEEGIWNEALKKVKEGFDPRTVEDAILEKKHIANDVEVATLLHRQIDLNNKLRDAIDANDTPRQARIEDELDRNEKALRQTGTFTSAAFRIRKAIAKENYTLAHQESLLRADLGHELTKELKERLMGYDKKYRDLQKELNDYLAGEEKRVNDAAQKKFERENKFQQRQSHRADVKANLKVKREKLVADVKEIFKKQRATLSANPIPLEAAPKLAQLAKNYFAEGAVKFEEVLDKMYQDFKDELDGLTKEHLRDAILGVNDFKKTPKVKTSEQLRIEADMKRIERKFDSEREKVRLSKRSLSEKVQDTFVQWERAFKLSGITTLAKLTSAAITRSFTTRGEEIIGAGITKLLPKKITSKAYREAGLNVKAEAKAMTQGWIKGMKDAYDVINEGKSDLDLLYGGKLELPPEAVNFLGQLHGALKTVTKRSEFERSFEKRMANMMKDGVDVENSMVQAKIGMDAYKDANRSIFLHDNFLTDLYQNGINYLERNSKYPKTGKAVSSLAKFLLPFVKVPTNIVGETFTYVGGSIKGSYLLIDAMKNGMDNVTPEQADVIMRNFKKGSIGLGLLALGYYNSENLGGYYQEGEKRKEGDVKSGGARIFGTDIPSWLLHAPAFEVMQLGATVRRLMDAKHKGDPTPAWEAASRGALGLTEEVPFVKEVEEIGKMLDPKEFHYYLGELAKNTVDPIALQQIAKWTDDLENRYPNTIWGHVESGLPILRENVPSEKNQKSDIKGGLKEEKLKGGEKVKSETLKQE